MAGYELARPWFGVRLRLGPGGRLEVALAAPGRAVIRPSATDWSEYQGLARGVGISHLGFPPRGAEFITELLATVPDAGPSGARTTIPAFVTAPDELVGLRWERDGADLLPGVDERDRVVLVRSAPRDPKRAALVLSLVVRGVGKRGRETVADLASAGWPDLADDAVELQYRPGPARGAADIIVVGQDDLAAVLRGQARLSPARRVRLVVAVVDQTAAVAPMAADWRPPSGTALLQLDRADHNAVRGCLDAVVHDMPLHDVVAALAADGQVAALTAGPNSVHALRIADAYADVVRRVRSTATSFHIGSRADVDVLPYISIFRDPGRAEATYAIRTPAPAFDVAGIGGLGISHVAETQRWRGVLDQSFEWAQQSVNAIPPDDTAPLEAQPRVVEVALERDHPTSLSPDPFVHPAHVLVGGGEYGLSVHIGTRWEDSLVVGNPPPIDLLLPAPPEGGLPLDVAVFAKDFHLRSPPLVTIRLPPFGASDTAGFALTAPDRAGPCSLRVGVYSGDHLIQSYLLESVIEREERVADSPVTRVTLEQSRTRGFTNVAELGPRQVSIGINQDVKGTHQVNIKGGPAVDGLNIEVDLVESTGQKYRSLLEEVLRRRATAAPDLRKFIDLGKTLHRALFQRATGGVSNVLRGLREASAGTVQIVRYALNEGLPWPAVYDWDLPRAVVGIEPSVCLGRDATTQGPCTHGPASGAYCVKGFWAWRFAIEEILAIGLDRDGVANVAVPLAGPAVRLAIGTRDALTGGLAAALGRTIGTGSVDEIKAAESLLDVCWSHRPPVVVVVGHHATASVPGEPSGDRILTGSAEKWLLDGEVIDRRLTMGDWADPHSLVLLVSCGSNAPAARDPTGFALAFSTAGASAVIGTECTVYTPEASQFATTIIDALWGQTEPAVTLGEAVRAWRSARLLQGDASAFAFNLLGDADARLVRS
ncbi:MAG: C25 family cysteine peptidase [Actinomycetota bacterium]|nr:C25 family cysteine peptidase [Actinomycetota bacterium]